MKKVSCKTHKGGKAKPFKNTGNFSNKGAKSGLKHATHSAQSKKNK